MKHKYVGKQYDYKRVLHFFFAEKYNNYWYGNKDSLIEQNASKFQDTSDQVVCSHHLFKAFESVSLEFAKSVKLTPGLDYKKFGTFTINDFASVHHFNPKLF